MDHQLYTPAIRSIIKEPNFVDRSKQQDSESQNPQPQKKMLLINQSQPQELFNKHKITFENVIKQPNFEKVVRVNKDKLFSYDQNLLFGHNKDAFRPSMFNYVLPELMSQKERKRELPQKEEQSAFIGMPPSKLWEMDKKNELMKIDPKNKRQISIFSEYENIKEDTYCMVLSKRIKIQEYPFDGSQTQRFIPYQIRICTKKKKATKK